MVYALDDADDEDAADERLEADDEEDDDDEAEADEDPDALRLDDEDEGWSSRHWASISLNCTE